MVALNSMPIPTQPNSGERSLDTVELIDRMAHDLKASSDADLPHCYFVEQAKLRLAGVHTRERAANDTVKTVSKNIVNGPSSVFYAWAIPE